MNQSAEIALGDEMSICSPFQGMWALVLPVISFDYVRLLRNDDGKS